jgi:hypothetical protein
MPVTGGGMPGRVECWHSNGEFLSLFLLESLGGLLESLADLPGRVCCLPHRVSFLHEALERLLQPLLGHLPEPFRLLAQPLGLLPHLLCCRPQPYRLW